MEKVHTVYRVVRTGIGAAYAVPMKAYADKDVADNALQENAAGLADVIEGNVIVKTERGPRAVMTVKQLLNELGIVGWSYTILTQDVHASLLVTPTSAIIKP